MSPTLNVILVICVLIITLINIFFLSIAIVYYIRFRRIISRIDKVTSLLEKFSSKWVSFLVKLFSEIISVFGLKKKKQVEKTNMRR